MLDACDPPGKRVNWEQLNGKPDGGAAPTPLYLMDNVGIDICPA